MTTWRCLLLVYTRIDVRLPRRFFGGRRFVHELSDEEVGDAVASFRCFPGLVEDLTDGAAGIQYDIIHCDRPLTSLTGDRDWWPTPYDIRPS